MKISGEFDVQLEPLPATLSTEGTEYQSQRFGLRKTFHGAFQATSVGDMMAAGSVESGAGAYVAIDIVTATLENRTGTFLLTHRGTRTSTSQALAVEVVPGSGTGDLKTISGTLGIRIDGGKHFYDFDYSL
jgi:hypothetical protein